LEDSKLNPEENNSIESSTNLNEDNKDLNEGNKKEENVKAFTEFLEKASNQDSSEEKVNLDSEQKIKGIGLLPLKTTFFEKKLTRQINSESIWPCQSEIKT